MKIIFHDSVDEELIKYVIIASRYEGRWVFCKHRDRTTLEMPAGHREEGESVIEAARRELYEETGATDYEIQKIGAFCVEGGGSVFSMLLMASIRKLSPLPDYEIEKIELLDDIPENLTYPDVQRQAFEIVKAAIDQSY
ncbi:NUDIX hydrolase [Peptoclostridium acidaminophilum DSM 3953]|uniref:NUDIX hydrolase n=1 Tax=Peptoclostridium acidaminophilum DSM 3953 TaxID=1286171 RepID=W8T654_PEPAC|nr:NUDIX domain-containing protein [Peptoclostridium acidaminophilum]AHM56360.1 NUDIX hydrolase [Peptoclostridium acidaminophilum DSM 3953]